MTTSKKRKSVTLKSVLRFNVFIVMAFISLPLLAARVQDRLLFRVNQAVVGVHDLEVAHADLSALSCRFPDSLVIAWVGDKFLPKLKAVSRDLGTSQENLSSNQGNVIFLASVTKLWKVLLFADTQDVALRADLEKKIIKVAGCDSILFANKSMRDSFRRWLRLEIYLRSRYAPNGMSTERDWVDKRRGSINQFAESIDKQLPHENFW